MNRLFSEMTIIDSAVFVLWIQVLKKKRRILIDILFIVTFTMVEIIAIFLVFFSNTVQPQEACRKKKTCLKNLTGTRVQLDMLLVCMR